MAIQTLPAFTIDGAVGASFGSATSSVALPGTNVSGDALVVLTNLGPLPVWVALGSSTVTVAVSAGSVVMPGQQRVLARGSATYLAGIVQGAGTPNANNQYGILAVETGN